MAKAVAPEQAQKETTPQMKKKSAEQKPEEFQRFEEFTRKLIAVPKKEIDQQKAKYEKQKPAKSKPR